MLRGKHSRGNVCGALRARACPDVYGVIIPHTAPTAVTDVIPLIENRPGADSVVAITRFDKVREARLFSELAYRLKVDGIILSGSGELINNIDEIPLVTIGTGKIKIKNGDYVNIGLHSGILKAVSLFKEYGHREVGFIGEALTVAKLEEFRKAMRQVGLPINERYIATSVLRFAEAGEDCMKKILQGGQPPTAILAAYDQIAFGAMKQARLEGYRIPEDISFVGIDNISATQFYDVPLTSIHIQMEDICERVVDLIFKRMDNKHYRERAEIVIPTAVTLRESLCRRK